MKTCKECKFFKVTFGHHSEEHNCVRHAPTILLWIEESNYNGEKRYNACEKTKFPKTSFDAFCGDWESAK